MKKWMIRAAAAVCTLAVLLAGLLKHPYGPGGFLFASAERTLSSAPVLLIDAGHGGFDGGAVAADGTVEAELNLQIACKLRDMARVMGFVVRMTREGPEAINDASAGTIRQKKISDIHNRLSLLEEGDADCLVSIHQNKFSQSKYRGTQVFYSANNPEGKQLASAIQESVCALLQPENTRTIKPSTRDIYLLYHAQKPAVLVECGFLSNSAETELLKDDDYQNKLCFAILGGLFNHFYGMDQLENE